jgi:23S rRNA (uracil1939-C5)-methyltransferase
MENSEIFELFTTNIGSGGDAVAELNNNKIYIPYALAQEKVKVIKRVNKKQTSTYDLIEILEPSPDRIEAFCNKFTECGGCVIQNLHESKYKKWKESLISDPLTKQNIDFICNPLQIVKKKSRRRISISYKNFKGRIELGFYQKNSKIIVDIDNCPLLTDRLNNLLQPLKELLSEITSYGQSGHFLVTDTENAIDIAFCPARKIDLDPLFEKFSNFAHKYNIARITRAGKELIILRYNPMVNFAGRDVSFPPAAFLQPSKEGEVLLQQILLNYLNKYGDKVKKVADLFCGLGTFTLILAENYHILASDVFSPSLLELQKIGNNSIDIIERNLIDNPLTKEELINLDLVIIDPPRSGAKMQVIEICKANIELVIYISCNLSSFFRDIEILIQNNYKLLELTPIDQFPYTNHLEVSAIFKKIT